MSKNLIQGAIALAKTPRWLINQNVSNRDFKYLYMFVLYIVLLMVSNRRKEAESTFDPIERINDGFQNFKINEFK